MKAPTCKDDGTIAFTSVKRKIFSKTNIRSLKQLAISEEARVVA